MWVVVSLIVPPWLHGATRLVAGYDTAAITLLTAFFVVLLSAVTDIVYALLDPRIRLS